MRGKRVTERVGADGFFQPDFFCKRFNNHEHHDAAKLPAVLIEEYKILLSFLYIEMAAYLLHVNAKQLDGHASDGHKPFFISLACYFNEAHFKMYIGNFQIDKLRNTQAAAV